MDNGISILIPTRGRPDNMERVVSSAIETAAYPHLIQFCFYIDNDDKISKDKADELLNKYPNLHYVQSERIVLSQMWNRAYEISLFDILMHGGDDIEFQTEGWDKKVYEGFNQYPDRIVLVGGNDGSGSSVHDGNFFTHGFVHRKWIEATDNILFHSSYSSDYNDTALNEIAKELNRWHHIDIMTEHHHPNFNKGPLDQTHLDRIERHKRDNPAQQYDNDRYKRVELRDKLQQAINNFKG